MRLFLALLAAPILALAAPWSVHFDRSETVDFATSITCASRRCFATGAADSASPPVLMQTATGDFEEWRPTSIDRESCGSMGEISVTHAATHIPSGVVMGVAVEVDTGNNSDFSMLVQAELVDGSYTLRCLRRIHGSVISIKHMSAAFPTEAAFAVLVAIPSRTSTSANAAGNDDIEYAIHTVRRGFIHSTVYVEIDDATAPITHFAPLNATSFMVATTRFPWTEQQQALDVMSHCRRISPQRCERARAISASRLAALNKRSNRSNSNGEYATRIYALSDTTTQWDLLAMSPHAMHDLSCSGSDFPDSICAAALTNAQEKVVLLSRNGGATWSEHLTSQDRLCIDYLSVWVSETAKHIAVGGMDEKCNAAVYESADRAIQWNKTLETSERYVIQGIEVHDSGLGTFRSMSADWERYNILFGYRRPECSDDF